MCDKTLQVFDEMEAELADLRAQLATRTFTCKAKTTADPPQDCDWPKCGCDPYADKVLAALEEEGLAAAVEDLAAVDRILDRRDALSDCVNRTDKILRLIRIAGERDPQAALVKAEADLAALRAAHERLKGRLNDLVERWHREADAVKSTERGPIDYRETRRLSAAELADTVAALVPADGAHNKEQ